jgi:hypothetical protein
MTAAYNKIISDIFRAASNHNVNAMWVVTRLYLLNNDPATLDMMEATNSTIVFDMDKVRQDKDPLIQAIMKDLDLCDKLMEQLEEYWKTTPDWANGEDIM